MTDKWILNSAGEPLPCRSLRAWAQWFEKADNQRRVGRTVVGRLSEVSTVFLAHDHNCAPSGPPLLWETMIFGGPLTHQYDRCAGSREQAEAMHRAMVAKVRAYHRMLAIGQRRKQRKTKTLIKSKKRR